MASGVFFRWEGRSADRVFAAHLLLIAIVVGAHVVTKLLLRIDPATMGRGTAAFFDLALERNLPTYFSTLALVVTGCVAIAIARKTSETGRGGAIGWVFVAACLFFMAADEALAIHDGFSPALRAQWTTSGVLYHAWVLVYGALAVLVALLCLPLVRSLSRATFLRLAFAAVVFIGSAIGFELLQSSFLSQAVGGDANAPVNWGEVELNPLNAVSVIAEESGEMLGVALALRALILHYCTELGSRPA